MWKRILSVLCGSPPATDNPTDQMPSEQSCSDPQKRQALLSRIGDINDFSKPRPLVTIAEFFEGNNDFSSIGYNLSHANSPQDWYEHLRLIANRPDVYDVRIEVKDLEDPEGWPATDTIWIITTASKDEVQAWIPDHFGPDELIDGFENTSSIVEPFEVPSPYRAIGLWYD